MIAEEVNVCQYLTAYDRDSYMFGVVFCCCIGVLPAVVATAFFFVKMFMRLRVMAAELQEAQKCLQTLKDQIFVQVSTCCHY